MNLSKIVSGFFTGSKGITDAGKSLTVKFGESINGNTLKTNLAKYGLVPAVAGGGIGLGIVGVGAGVSATTNMVTNGFMDSLGLTDKDGDGAPDNGITAVISSAGSWFIFILIALGIVFVVKYATSGKGKK